MIQTRQLQKLFEILNAKQQSLEEIEANFLTIFNEAVQVFNASFAISNLLNLNLLTSQQRITAIFLLIENFKSQGFKRHPFGSTILNISQKTTQPYERRLIADLIIDSKREKYSKYKIQGLFDEQQVLIEMGQQRPQIKKLRDEFIAGLPKISQSKRSEVHSVISDFNQKDKKQYPPQYEANKANIKEAEISNDAFTIGFMRPIPTFIDIAPSEYNWLSPGILTDVHWDNTAEIEKKLLKCRQLINKALDHHLTKDESTQVDRSLQIQPYAVLNLNVSCQNLNLLIKNNPFVAVSFLVKMMNYPLVSEYLQSILLNPISINSIDVIARLAKAARLPTQYIEVYALKNIKEVTAMPEHNKERGKMARIIALFIRNLMKNKIFDVSKYQQELQEFVNTYIEIQQVQNLKKVSIAKHD